jgi:serine/threonine protein kinase
MFVRTREGEENAFARSPLARVNEQTRRMKDEKKKGSQNPGHRIGKAKENLIGQNEDLNSWKSDHQKRRFMSAADDNCANANANSDARASDVNKSDSLRKKANDCPDVIREFKETVREMSEGECRITTDFEQEIIRNDSGTNENKSSSASSSASNSVGNLTCKNAYTRQKMLGKGGFAVVYAVRCQKTENSFACKVVSKKNLEKPKQREKMIAEIRIHRMSEHEFICKFSRCFEDDLNVYILMEKCSDRTLADVIKHRGAVTETETAMYGWEISQAMVYLHSKNIVHRDLKLGNVFLTDFGLKEASKASDLCEKNIYRKFSRAEDRLNAFHRMERSFLEYDDDNNYNDGEEEQHDQNSRSRRNGGQRHRIKIGDFGLAVQLANKRELKYQVCGTPNYIAPEVLGGSTGPGHAFPSDVWSLGVMLYALLCGEPPFQTESVEATYARIKSTPPDFSFPDDEQCFRVLASEHLTAATTKKTTNASSSTLNNNKPVGLVVEEEEAQINNTVINKLPKYRLPISSRSRDLVGRCLLANANERLSGVEILEHPFFDGVANRIRRQISSSSTSLSSHNGGALMMMMPPPPLETISLEQMEKESRAVKTSWTRRRSTSPKLMATYSNNHEIKEHDENYYCENNNKANMVESTRMALTQISVNDRLNSPSSSVRYATNKNNNNENENGEYHPAIVETSPSSIYNRILAPPASTKSLSSRVKVRNFTDQTDQWGLGYVLTDDSYGAIFNDESRAILTKCKQYILYWPAIDSDSSHSSRRRSDSYSQQSPGAAGLEKISPRKKFSSKRCIAVTLINAQKGTCADDRNEPTYNRDLAKKTAILLRFKEMLLKAEGKGNNGEKTVSLLSREEEEEAFVQRQKQKQNAADPNYYYDKNPLYDVAKTISLLLDRGCMINYWRTGRSKATTFTFNDGSYQTLFGDSSETSVFCFDDYSADALGVSSRRLAICTQKRNQKPTTATATTTIPSPNDSNNFLSNTSRYFYGNDNGSKEEQQQQQQTMTTTTKVKVLDCREVLSKSSRFDSNLDKCVRYCHESGMRLERVGIHGDARV